MRYSIHSILRSAALPLLVGALILGCSEAPTAPLPEASDGVAGLSKHTPTATGRATLHPQNQSGVMGRIRFTDDGSTTLTIEGTATGLIPPIPLAPPRYASLIYDNGSHPGGPDPGCEPTIFPPDPDNILFTMFVGIWAVDGAGNGTLSEVNILNDITGARDYVPLSKFRSMSIRDLTVPGPFGPGSGPDAVVACGQEATHPAG